MKKKYLILANSLTYNTELEIHEEDFTDSDLADDDILYALDDKCMEIEQQGQMNTLVLSPDEVNKLATWLAKDK